MPLQITMDEPQAPVQDYLQFRVRRGEDDLVYGDWTHIHRDGAGSDDLHASAMSLPVVHAWAAAKEHALIHDLEWVYIEDHECLLDADRLGLMRGPTNTCSGERADGRAYPG